MIDKLEDIGFYTLSDKRVKQSNQKSQMWRCEILLTDKCNFHCPYCRGMYHKGDLEFSHVKKIIDIWCKDKPLKNIRFSGGEPLFYPYLLEVIDHARNKKIKRIAISSNGSLPYDRYEELMDHGVNDFSISLDACCSSFGKEMCGGINNAWETVVSNIKKIARKCYITLGMVFTERTIDTVVDVITFGSSLGVADIRIISSAQYNRMIKNLKKIPRNILDKHPILNYRVGHYLNERNVRGISKNDSHRCGLVIDDSAVSGNYHYPCIIYLREGGKPIGKISPNMRTERIKWYQDHDTHEDSICKNNCLDVCIDYNNKFREDNELEKRDP